MPSPRSKPSLTSLVAFAMLLTALYVLSYAPVFRCVGDPGYRFGRGRSYYLTREGWQELYRPVEWLTDNTPLREPLLFWAGLWGEEVEEDFRIRSDRSLQGEDPNPTYGVGGGRGFF